MEQETLIYIEEKDRKEAARLASDFTLEDTLKRAYINALGSELAMKYLAQENISVSNIYNLHNIHKLREEFDIADIMLPNIHIDVRTTYNEEFIFIPKSHFEYDLTPDIYLAFYLFEDASCAKFLGFFEPKLINKNNQNKDYYFIEKEKLSHPSDLKNYVLNFKGNTTEALSEDELNNGRELAMSLIDHDITDSDKKNLIKLLIKSSTLREDLIEFDNFEWLSYHVATNEDVDLTSQAISMQENIINDMEQPDEFDIFEEHDEFDKETTLDEISENNDILDNNFENDISENEDLFEINETLDEQLTEFEDTLDESKFEEEQTNTDNNQNDDTEDYLKSELETGIIENEESLETGNVETTELEQNSNEEITENFDLPSLDMETNDNIDSELIDLPNIDEIEELTSEDTPTNVTDDNLLPEENIIPDVTEKIHLSEFNELPFDTNDSSESDVNSIINDDFELNINDDLNLDLDEIALETSNADKLNENDNINSNISEMPELQTQENIVDKTNFEELGERDDIKPVEETPFKDDEIKPLDKIESRVDDSEISNNDYKTETTKLDELEYPIENSTSQELTTENDDTIEKVSFKDLDKLFSEETSYDEPDIEENSENAENTSELLNLENSKGNATSDVDFLETLAEEQSSETQPSAESNLVYENTTVISNVNTTPGEILIDINQPDVEISTINDDELEKLEVLYNNNENIENTIDIKTSIPEKGKKAMLIASTLIVALAGLLVYASINKSNNLVAEKTNTNILENNLPKLDEQKVPEENMILPSESKPKENLESTAKKATQNINKKNAPLLDAPYLDVKKLSWSVPDYVSYNDDFRKYLQTAGRSLKLSLSSDLLLATEYAYSDQVQVNVVLSKEGVIQDAKILQSSGSSQIDKIVLRTVNDTLKVVKAPTGVIIGDSIQLTLKIYL